MIEEHHQPLSLPVPAPVVVSAPPVPPVIAPPVRKPNIMQEVINHLLVPALRIMPQRPEDIGKHNRPPVVKPDA